MRAAWCIFAVAGVLLCGIERKGDGPTPEKGESESESESETNIGSELEHRLKTDAAGIKDLNRYIRETKERHAGILEKEDAEIKQGEAQPAEKEGENMFGAFDTQKRTRAEGVNITGASAHDWDDVDGYYKPQLAELMDERYLVFADSCGKGVFSNVAKAKDRKHNTDVAIKVIRNNDMMRKAAEKEIAILCMLNHHDRGDKRFVIRLLRTFEYRGHLCMVFECMWDNARTAIKKLGRPGRGVSLNLVHAWTRQLFIALRLMQKCNIIHADLKPDNLLVGGSGKVGSIVAPATHLFPNLWQKKLAVYRAKPDVRRRWSGDEDIRMEHASRQHQVSRKCILEDGDVESNPGPEPQVGVQIIINTNAPTLTGGQAQPKQATRRRTRRSRRGGVKLTRNNRASRSRSRQPSRRRNRQRSRSAR